MLLASRIGKTEIATVQVKKCFRSEIANLVKTVTTLSSMALLIPTIFLRNCKQAANALYIFIMMIIKICSVNKQLGTLN